MWRCNRRLPLIALGLWFVPWAAQARHADQWFYGNDAWVDGAQLNLGFLGHLGKSDSTAAPPGGFFAEGQYGVWLEHFVEAHLEALKSINSQVSFFGIGAGARLNVLEFSRSNALDFAADNTMEMRCVETRRGLLAYVLQSMLIHFDVSYDRFWFSDSDPAATYERNLASLRIGGGAQWAPNIHLSGLSRFYIDTSASFTQLSGVYFVVPSLGLGLNF